MTEEKLVELERELAESQARMALDSYGRPEKGGWRHMEWDYLQSNYPGKEETRFLRKCWRYAVMRGLIEVRNKEYFRFAASHRN